MHNKNISQIISIYCTPTSNHFSNYETFLNQLLLSPLSEVAFPFLIISLC